MREPFPVLTKIQLSLNRVDQLAYELLPARGLPCLQELVLDAVYFRLPDFPLFSRPRDASSCRLIASFPDPKGSAPDARIVLPALTSIGFDRVCGYVEDLLARIDCPRLNSIRLQHHLRPSVEIQHSQIFKFIDRSEDLKLSQINQVYMYLSLIISHSTFLVNANIMRSSRSTTPFGKLRT